MHFTNLMCFFRLISIIVISGVIYLLMYQLNSIQDALKLRDNPKININPFWQRDSQRRGESNSATQLKDWHELESIAKEATRKGIGELGQASKLDDPPDPEFHRILSKQNGFNAFLSDQISVNRLLPDIRSLGCKNKKYFANLPSVSIVIPFNNEHFTALVRSLHSLVNRSPPELLREIILVDDYSDRTELKRNLDRYVKAHIPKAKIIRLPQRMGLIAARLAGVDKAVGDVLVFLDAHIEANYNWLPPLLHLIALDKRTVVCPMIDVIDDRTFEYSAQDEGARGAFDWNFDYKRLPLLKSNKNDPTEPYENPIMSGGIFAISREWFWELGAYDDGLEIWGGEQYELSFKIWMCGGRLLDAPCSRVGHIFRNAEWDDVIPGRDDDYVHRNFKRVAEVWMDDYKHYIYNKANGTYEKIDAGNLTKQLELRNKLHCKSFKWFIENVAFDLVKMYPPKGNTDFAFGQVRSVGASNLCLDTLGPPDYSFVGLRECDHDTKFPSRYQDWALSEDHDMRMRGEDYCLRAADLGAQTSFVIIFDCHFGDPNQVWYYNRRTQWLMYSEHEDLCLKAMPENKRVILDACKTNNALFKWTFVHVNNVLLDQYFKTLPNKKKVKIN
ncbi:N-acetylgalactosaminyltransferase 6-like isoform X2 [Eurosta solidaginis]|uniref:N-acetylgalactosaminyltransferase 6-like isoform X2 n=1 Tax=Eurosta solidaginis TaxID=178769 RepID=UPI003530BDBC